MSSAGEVGIYGHELWDLPARLDARWTETPGPPPAPHASLRLRPLDRLVDLPDNITAGGNS